MLILNQRQLGTVLAEYVAHFNAHRPHRTLNQAAPLQPLPSPASPSQLRVRRRDRASRTGELAYSTVASSCVTTRCVATPGDPDLGGDPGCGDRVVVQGASEDGCWHVPNVLADGGRAAAAGRDAAAPGTPRSAS
jgi:hypothetical protein